LQYGNSDEVRGCRASGGILNRACSIMNWATGSVVLLCFLKQETPGAVYRTSAVARKK